MLLVYACHAQCRHYAGSVWQISLFCCTNESIKRLTAADFYAAAVFGFEHKQLVWNTTKLLERLPGAAGHVGS